MCRSDRDQWWAGGIFAPFLYLRNFFRPHDAGLIRMKAREKQRRSLKAASSSFTVYYEELRQ